MINRILRLLKIKKKLKSDKDNSSFYTKDLLISPNFKIGEYTYGCPEIYFEDSNMFLTIGKFCSIARGVKIYLGGNHRTDWFTTYPFNVLNIDFPNAENIKGHPATKGNVIIGNDVWIGADVTIMSGVTIGDGAVIAANALITKEVKSYEIWGGNPAKLIRKRFNDEQIKLLLEKKWWNWEVSKINENVNILCSDNYELLKTL